MRRVASNWWLVLLWIPVLALALGLVVGCASLDSDTAQAIAPPTHAELQRLVALELDANSRFDSFGASDNQDARRIATIFRPVLADVTAVDCRAAPAHSLDCTLEVVLRFPAMDGRESRTFWERRLQQTQAGWHLVGQAQP